MKQKIVIANASGFWGDEGRAIARQVLGERVHDRRGAAAGRIGHDDAHDAARPRLREGRSRGEREQRAAPPCEAAGQALALHVMLS